MIQFIVPGEPVQLDRARQGRDPRGRPIWYTPKQSGDQKKLVHTYARAAMVGHRKFEGGVLLGAAFYRHRPTDQKKHPEYPTQAPDLDNLMKLVADALQGVMYENDAQIVGHFPWPFTGKHYTEAGGSSCTVVRVASIEEVGKYVMSPLFKSLLEEQDARF